MDENKKVAHLPKRHACRSCGLPMPRPGLCYECGAHKDLKTALEALYGRRK